MTLEVRPTGTRGFAVFDGPARVSGTFSSREEALSRRDHMIAQQAQRTRSCLCCRTPFLSEGAHNRLCNRCRHRTDEAVAHGMSTPRRSPRAP